MRRVAERAEIGIVRGLDPDAAAGAHQAVKFLHGPDHIGEVLDDVNGTQLVEGAVGERVGSVVEVAENVGAAVRIPVDADGTRVLIDAAADIKHFQLIHLDIILHWVRWPLTC
jgi:hypothetical protein